MRNIVLVLLALPCLFACEQPGMETLGEAAKTAHAVVVVEDSTGHRLQVNGQDFFINGMNWDYFPIGTNYEYSLWSQPDEVIEAALDYEMTLLKKAGVNAIRHYTGIPARWITYIYEKHGIYTMLNHSFARYGLTIEGEWVATTDYADPRVKKILIEETTAMVAEYKDTKGLLLFLLGNENNYGLFWEGPETEDFPVIDESSEGRARALYQLFNEATLAMKGVDSSHPIAICNGDLQFLDIISQECKDIDIFGTNIYRGVSFGDTFRRVRAEYNKPLMFTEFGADALHALKQEEDQFPQALYLRGNWKEIYQNAAGLGLAQNAIGGFTFQFSDGWWKYGQTINLDVHDNNASWANGGYIDDYYPGDNNMNEEWFGICAKGEPNACGLYPLHPRAAYYTLAAVHQVQPYAPEQSAGAIEEQINKIDIENYVRIAAGEKESPLSSEIANLQEASPVMNDCSKVVADKSTPGSNE